MIPLTRTDGTAVLVNPDRIELIEETPDTVVTEPFDPDGDLVVAVSSGNSQPPVALQPVVDELALLAAAAAQPGKYPERLELGLTARGGGICIREPGTCRVRLLGGGGQRVFSVGGRRERTRRRCLPRALGAPGRCGTTRFSRIGTG